MFVVVLALSHDALHVPPPNGSRWRMPVDQNESLTLTPASPNRKFDGGVTLLEWPTVVDTTGAKRVAGLTELDEMG